MQVPLRISFHNMERTEDIEAQIREKIAKLEKFCDRITSCHVMIDEPHQHHRQGNQCQVRIQIAVPQRELVVDRQLPQHQSAEDLRVALREAFDEMRRQLADYELRRQLEDDIHQLCGQTKQHVEPVHDRVDQVFPDANDGSIESSANATGRRQDAAPV